MLALIPVLVLLLAASRMYLWQADKTTFPITRREALLIGALFCAVWSAVGSELLGLMGEIRFWPVLVLWLIPLAILSVRFSPGEFWRAIKGRNHRDSGTPASNLRPLTRWGQFSLLTAAIIMVYALGSALLSPPNNYDALGYHLPRIIFWMQQHSLADFPTSNALQLAMPPGMEMIGLQLMVLAHRSDWAINLVGWTTVLLLGMVASLICRELGGEKDSEALSVLLVVSMPMAFCSASTFTPEIIEALWTALAALWLLRIAHTRYCPRIYFLFIALAIALMPLTHGTGYLFGLPIAIFTTIAFWRVNRRRAVAALLLIGAMVLVLNAGYLTRNVRQFGGPFGPLHSKDPRLVLINGVINGQTILANLLRTNGSMFSGPSHTINEAANFLIAETARLLHVNLQNKQTMYLYTGLRVTYDGATYHAGNEDRVGWPFQMLLFLLIPLGLFLVRAHPATRARWLFLLLPAGCLVLVATILRWQAIENHLLPVFPVLIIPVAAIALNSGGIRVLMPIFIIGLFAWLFPTMILYPRTLVGSQGAEFHSREYLLCRDHGRDAKNIEKITDYLQSLHPQPHLIGLQLHNVIFYEYALMSPLLHRMRKPPVFVVFNANIQVPGHPEPNPNVLIGPANEKRLIHHDTGTVYIRAHRFGYMPLAIFVSEKKLPDRNTPSENAATTQQDSASAISPVAPHALHQDTFFIPRRGHKPAVRMSPVPPAGPKEQAPQSGLRAPQTLRP